MVACMWLMYLLIDQPRSMQSCSQTAMQLWVNCHLMFTFVCQVCNPGDIDLAIIESRGV